jgi:DNA-binding GntR family transcriptional regulator
MSVGVVGVSGEVDRGSPLGSQIANALRRDVLLGRLVPGTKVSQQELCERFGTSRMPVRDALRSLVHEGLMFVDSTRHIIVAPLSRDDMIDAFAIEGELTGMAAERASRRATAEDLETLDGLDARMREAARDERPDLMVDLNWQFHRKLNHMAGSRKLLVAIRKVSVDLPRDFLAQLPERNAKSNEQHKGIIGAIRDRRHELAGELMKDHVVDSGYGLVNHLVAFGVQFD